MQAQITNSKTSMSADCASSDVVSTNHKGIAGDCFFTATLQLQEHRIAGGHVSHAA